MTKLNQNILNMIQSSDGHLTAEQAFLLAKKKKIDVSMASIYRILGKLSEDGYIKRISVSGMPDVFDKTLEEHEHLVCYKCGIVEDIHINDLKKILSKQVGFDVKEYDLNIKYLCKHCRKKGERL